jgi:2-iminobutanoate/2-iminopropanoate deaminase
LDDIEFLSPPGAIKPTGPWSLGVRAGDFVFVAGMRGIDPATNKLVEGDEARIRQAFVIMKTIVAAAAAVCATQCASWSMSPTWAGIGRS